MLRPLCFAVCRNSGLLNRVLPFGAYIWLICKVRCYLSTGSFRHVDQWFES